MNCKIIQNNLQSYIDRRVDETTFKMIRDHLEECPVCRDEEQSYLKMIDLLKTPDYPKPDEGEWQRMHDAILRQLPPVQDTPKVVHFFPLFSLFNTPIRAVAALIVVSLISVSVIYFSGRSNTLLSGEYPKITAIEGYAFIDASSAPLSGNHTLTPGRSIQTDDNSSLQIQVDQKSTVHVDQNTNCSVTDFNRDKTVFRLNKGGMAARVSKRKPSQVFRIETPNAFCEVIGTRFDVTTQRDRFRNRFITTLVVHEGTVKFGEPDNHLFVKAGKAVAIFGDSLGIPSDSDDPLIRQLRELPGKGYFTVTSVPSGADITIDGVHSGTTPLSEHLAYGNHSIRISKDGYNIWSGSLAINAERRALLDVELQALSVSQTGADFFNKNSALQEAVTLVNSGKYSEAKSGLEELIGNPSLPPALRAVALTKLGICQKNTGDYEEAVRTLSRVIDGRFANEQKYDALFQRATIYKTLLHDSKNAINDLYRYTKEYQNGIWVEEATYSLAELLHFTNRFDEAAEVYNRYCNTYKSSIHREKVLYTLGTLFSQQLKDFRRATGFYNRLLSEFPGSRYAEDALFWKADCILHQGKPSLARNEFKKYIATYPDGKWASLANSQLKKIETAGVR